MRKLNGHDVFAAIRLVNEIGFEDQVRMLSAAMGKDTDIKELSFGLVLNIICNSGSRKAESLLWELLAGPLEIAPEELAQMEPLEIIEKVGSLKTVVSVENYKNFFKSLAGMVKQNLPTC